MLWKLLLLFSFSLPLFAQKDATDVPDEEKVQRLLDASLRFLISSQEQTTIEGKQYRGEWRVQMELTEPYFVLGKRKKVRDSNCFTVAAIHNFLAEIYLNDTSLTQLKPTLRLAFSEVQSYAVNEKYNFWKLLPPNRKLKLFDNPKPLPLVRRPTNYPLRSRLINNASNVPEDADDTSLGNLAKHYHNLIFGTNFSIISHEEFDNYVDNDRKNINWYNLLMHETSSTGAYLTWLHPEYRMWIKNPIQPFVNNLFIFFPGSSATPRAYEPWIPFGSNDVDAVVNANILTYLSTTNQLNTSQGLPESVQMIEGRIDKGMWKVTGIYYPNSCHIHYAVARAYASGITDLESTAEKVRNHLLQSQQPDGSFLSRSWLNNADSVQTTAYALHALLDLKKSGISVSDSLINSSVNLLMNKVVASKNESHWNGGVYFSGGTVIRNLLIWHSDAYTTALIAKCLQSYLLQVREKD